jgi:hypothetical protein
LANPNVVVLIDTRTRTLSIGDTPSPEWRGFHVPSYSRLDGLGDLLTTSARKRRHPPFPPGFRLPDWTRPSDGSVWPRKFDGRGYAVPAAGIPPEDVFTYLQNFLTWI